MVGLYGKAPFTFATGYNRIHGRSSGNSAISHCVKCQVGRFNPITAQTVCTVCPKGKFSNTLGNTACTLCASGKYQPKTEQTKCDNCPKGRWHGRKQTGAWQMTQHCDFCPSGKFQHLMGQLTCSTCPSGKYTNNFSAKINAQWTNHKTSKLELPYEMCHSCKTESVVPLRKWWTEKTSGWTRCTKHPLNCKRGAYGAWKTCTKSCKSNIHAVQAVDHLSHERSQKDKLGLKLRNPLAKKWLVSSWSPYGDHVKYARPMWHAWGGREASVLPAALAMKGANSHRSGYTPTYCNDPSFNFHQGFPSKQSYKGQAKNYFGKPESYFHSKVVWKAGSDRWERTERCNTHNCPIDCVVSPWTVYNTCNAGGKTRKCGGGRTTRTRTVVTKVQYGGKTCPPLSHSKTCNTHTCANAVCHDQHVRCKIAYVKYGRQSSCITKDCHKCASAYECRSKKISRVMQIVHDKRFAHVGYNKKQASRFQCKIVDARAISKDARVSSAITSAYWGGKAAVNHHNAANGMNFRTTRKHLLKNSACQCRCSHHPMGCFRKNWKFAGDFRQGAHAYIHGNIYTGIAHKEACSNLCSHHPSCKLWEFDTTGKCILRSNTAKKVQYVKNLNSRVTTYAGVSSHNSAGCLTQDRPTMCPYGKYVWTEQSSEKKYCLVCPKGKYTRTGSNQKRCYNKTERPDLLHNKAFVWPDQTTNKWIDGEHSSEKRNKPDYHSDPKNYHGMN